MCPPSDKQSANNSGNEERAFSLAGGRTSLRSTRILDQHDIRRALTRIAHEILERNHGAENLCLIGVHTRGIPLAHRIGQLIGRFEGISIPIGHIDIAGHRDDRPPNNGRLCTVIDFDLTNLRVILVDDVLYTGRSVRAALDALLEYGRPAQVQLAVLVDRGHRELPIRADYVGKNIPTSHRERVSVHLHDIDGEEAIYIERPSEEARTDVS